MTSLLSAFGLLGRFAGDLLTSTLAWASSLLFGRVPRSHQIFLTLMMAGSFLWLLVVMSLLLPGIASWLYSATPHPPSMDQGWLALFLASAAILLPPAVGAAGYLVPAEEKHQGGPSALFEMLRGYVLVPVLAGIMIFLAGVGVVRKIRSVRHGWKDVHVPVVIEAGGYDQLVGTLGEALASAGLPTTAAEAPWVLTLPGRILAAVAGRNVRRLRPDHLVELRGKDLRVGIYPSDIAISSTARGRIRARIAVLSRLTATTSRLTTSAEAQEMEDLLKQLATTAATDHGLGLREAREAFRDIDTRLLALEVPTAEWDLLYGLRLGLDRDVLAGSSPGTVFPGSVKGIPGAALAAPAGPAAPIRPRVQTQDGGEGSSGRGRGLSLRWLATASMLAFVALTIAVGSHVVFPFDAPLLATARTLNGVPGFWEFMSQTANFPLIAIAIGLILWLIRAKRYREAVLVALILAAVTAGSEGVKQLTARQRPSGSGDGIPGVVYSYPSGHVLESMTILGMLVVRVWRSARRMPLRVAFVVLVVLEVVLVGIGRLALNEHYPTDLLGGFLGSVTALGWYAWLTRPDGWADRPAALAARHRTTGTAGIASAPAAPPPAAPRSKAPA